MSKKYTHTDSSGMQFRMDGARPVSALADRVMAEVSSAEILNSIEAGKAKRGGARKGAGRKKGLATVNIQFKVPKSHANGLRAIMRGFIKAAKEDAIKKFKSKSNA